MRSRSYRRIEPAMAIRLSIEFDELTVGELSNILRQYQATLRTAWKIEASDLRMPTVPGPRLLTGLVSSRNSLEIVTEFALHAAMLSNFFVGPVANWPDVVRGTFHRLQAATSRMRIGARPAGRRGADPTDSDDSFDRRIVIQGGYRPRLELRDPSVLTEEPIARGVTELWRIAQGGQTDIILELLESDDQRDDT